MEKSVILITGGTSGFGKAAAKLFAEKGETVIVTGRSADKLKAVSDEYGVDYFRADVTSIDDWKKVYDYVIGKYGKIDLLLNNAGCGVSIEPLSKQTIADIDYSIDVNLKGTIYGCYTFIDKMIEQRSGTIINTASVCAQHGWPGFSVYTAAKFGVRGFTKSLYTEVRDKNIRVSCFVPAAGDTNFDVNARVKRAEVRAELKPEDVAQGYADIFYLPKHVVIEEVTMWGIDQEICPL